MTSAEFAAKYRVLKTVSERGARSQIAQEVALGRMVMIHHLDVGSAADCQRLLARVGSLDRSAVAKVFDVVTIDGTYIVITHFLATFTDLPTWLDQQGTAPGEAPTLVIPAQSAPRSTTPAPSAPAVAPTPPAAAPERREARHRTCL